MTTIKLRGNGTITLPPNVHKKYKMKEGGFLQLIDVGDGSFFLVPRESKVMEITGGIAKKLKDANITLDDLLETLDDELKRYYEEKYGKNSEDL